MATEPSQKACSVCGKSFAIKHFTYHSRENRSYCQACSKGNDVAYAKGGREAAKEFREAMRATWQR